MDAKLEALKAHLKELAVEVRTAKSNLKNCQRTKPYEAYKPQGERDHKKFDYRHKHIAYCLLRGTPYEKIENPREDNNPNWAIIEKIKEEHSYAKEDVCASA